MSKVQEEELTKNYKIIKCPHCGAEYLASEIFVPGELEGNAKSVIKDALNRIIYVEWEDDEEEGHPERYICDHCGHEFIVTPTISYKVVKQEEELDFNNLESSLL